MVGRFHPLCVHSTPLQANKNLELITIVGVACHIASLFLHDG